MEIMSVLARIKENALLVPAERLEKLMKGKTHADAFIYFLISIVIGMAISLPLKIAFNTQDVQQAGGLAGTAIGALIALPFLVPILYLFFAFQHLVLKFLGGKADFLASVQMLIYGATPNMLFGSVPFVGWIFSLISLYNIVLGAKKVHGLSLFRAAVAVVVIPFLAVFALAFVVAAVLVALVGPEAFTPGINVPAG